MIIFHDLILLDDDYVLTKHHQCRWRLLESIVRSVDGHAQMREGRILDFSRSTAMTDLRLWFGTAIAKGWEGLILKPDNEPYFSFEEPSLGNISAAWIKLKKDYIAGLGDTADFAIIGASYDGREASLLSIKGLRWTSFHVGCLTNKEDVCRFGAKPCFKEIDVLSSSNVNTNLMERLNHLGYFQEEPFERGKVNEHFDIKHDQPQLRKMTHLFKQPIVVDLMGASFEKPSGVTYFTLRFPRVQKIHEDRTFKDAISFDELQHLAKEAKSVPEDQRSQEEWEWISRLRATCSESPAIETLSEDSYCTTARASETTPLKRNTSVTPRGHSTRCDYRASLTPTKPRAAPMVRMDSGEMRPGETRLSSGEVVLIETKGALPTPPPTASQLEITGYSPSKKRKAPRGARDADVNMPVPPSKMPRLVSSKSPSIDNAPFTVATLTSLPPRREDPPSPQSRSLPKNDAASRKRKPSLPPIEEEPVEDDATEGEPSEDETSTEFVPPPAKRVRISAQEQSSPDSNQPQTRPPERQAVEPSKKRKSFEGAGDSSNTQEPRKCPHNNPQASLSAEGTPTNPIIIRDTQETESQSSVTSSSFTGMDGEPTAVDEAGTAQLDLECIDHPLHNPGLPSQDLSHPTKNPVSLQLPQDLSHHAESPMPKEQYPDISHSSENDALKQPPQDRSQPAKQRKKTHSGLRSLRETVRQLKEWEAELEAERRAQEAGQVGMESPPENGRAGETRRLNLRPEVHGASDSTNSPDALPTGEGTRPSSAQSEADAITRSSLAAPPSAPSEASNYPPNSDAPTPTETHGVRPVPSHPMNQVPANAQPQPSAASDSQTSTQSFHPNIPLWYPQTWPPPPNLLSTMPDRTLIYALVYSSISTMALSSPLRSEISRLLNTHFPKTHHTARLTPFLTDFSVHFPSSDYTMPPLVKIVLLDSQASTVRDTFNTTAKRTVDVIKKWKAQNRLQEAGKVLFLDYRVVKASVGLITDGRINGRNEMFEPGCLDEDREKRELLGSLWRENFWLGCVAWDVGRDGQVGMRFERSECL
jgi:hypothetical protein